MELLSRSVGTWGRAAAVLGAAGALLLCAPSPISALAALRASGPAGGAVAADLSAPLVALLALLAWALTAWLVIATLLMLSSRLPGLAGQASDALTRCLVPRAARRVLELALGLTVATGAVWGSPAYAADSGPGAAPAPAAVSAGAVSLDWPVAAAPVPVPAPASTPAPSSAAGGPVVVAPGDTLWSLTERSLGERATAAQVAAAWPSWWEANREAIGEDPDLLHPGQALSAPPPPPSD